MRLLAIGIVAALAAPTLAGEPAWKYVADNAFRPVLRSVALSDRRPDDLREDVAYRGTHRKYAQVRYGSADSRRVAVVIDLVSANDWDLYIDADRNRVIEAKDKIAGTGRQRTARLDVEITRGLDIRHERRTVLWRPGTGQKSISLATVGYVAGHVQLGGKRVAARRVDGDANGFFADAADRLWLDLDGDGQWDPIGEQFPLLPVLTIGKERCAVRGDALGTKLAIEPLTAEGCIRLRLDRLDRDAAVARLHVMLVAEDGSAFSVTSVDRPVIVPAGKYALGAVSLSLQHGSAPVHFVFSRTGLDDSVRWHELRKDQELVLDPIGKLRFELEIDKAALKPQAGMTIQVQPQLFTEDGLLINSCAHGDAELVSRFDQGRTASVKLLDAQQKVLDGHTSGFA